MLQPEFYLLNRVADANPDVPITQVENRLLGIGHNHIGAWLMRSWQMPDEIVTTVREHHNEIHRGDHSPYVHLMIVVDCLLKSHGIGDGPSRSVPPGSLNHLDLDLRRAMALTERLIRDYRVAVIPGSAFGAVDGCYLRISYGALDEATAAEGIARLVRGLGALC